MNTAIDQSETLPWPYANAAALAYVEEHKLTPEPWESLRKQIADVPNPPAFALQAVRVLQQQTVDTFVGKYSETIERQTSQLRGFTRLISHEIRQPLGVLQVLSRMIPVVYPQGQQMVSTLERNVASLALVREGETMLVDCGEGTQRQMMKYGISFNFGDVLITHWHADHYLGLMGLCRTLVLQDRTVPLRLWAPPRSR